MVRSPGKNVFLLEIVLNKFDLADIVGHQLSTVLTIPRNSLTCLLFLGMSMDCIASSLEGSGDIKTSPLVASMVNPANCNFRDK